MRIFITGSTGVIGKRVIPLLVDAGHQVTGMVHSPGKREEVERAGAASVHADLLDLESLSEALDGHDVAINLATHMPSSASRMFVPGAWHENDRIRLLGSANLVLAATLRGVGRLIQESFAPVYPDRQDRWIDESEPLKPARFNRTVADAEDAVARFTRAGGVGVVLRFAAFYGPDARLLTDLVGSVRHGFAPLVGPSESFISSVSHDDAATAVVAALELPSGVYNVCDDEPLRHREYVDALADAMNVRHPKLPPVWAAALAGSVGGVMARSQRISNRKLRESGWTPKFPSAREGWRATIGAYGA